MVTPIRFLLGVFLLTVTVGQVCAQVTFKLSASRYSSVDARNAVRNEKVWDILVGGQKTKATVIYLADPSEKPPVIATYRNKRGQTLFTVEQNFSDIGWNAWWLTFLYTSGKLKLISREWEAAGLNDRGDLLLKQAEGTHMDPASAPFTHVQKMLLIKDGRKYNLGIVEKAQLLQNGEVQGYFFEDKAGRRGNGHSDTGGWFKRYFLWKNGRTFLKKRVEKPA